MIVIGIDPGLATVGFGVIEADGGRVHPVSYGCIRTSARDGPPPERLHTIYEEFTELVSRHQPGWIAMERLYFTRNITSALGVAEVRGVIMLASCQKKIPLAEYTPTQVKQAITGSGKADKKQVQDMIRRLLGLEEIPRPDDAADGLSIALCHIYSMRPQP